MGTGAALTRSPLLLESRGTRLPQEARLGARGHLLPFPARASHLAPASGAGPSPGEDLRSRTCLSLEVGATPRLAGREVWGCKTQPRLSAPRATWGLWGIIRPRALAAWGRGPFAGDPPLPHLSKSLTVAALAQSVGSVVATQGDAGRPAPGCVARAPPPPRPESLSGW